MRPTPPYQTEWPNKPYSAPPCPEEGCVLVAHSVIHGVREHYDGKRSWKTCDLWTFPGDGSLLCGRCGRLGTEHLRHTQTLVEDR